jgi:hypothetical protein
MRLRRRGVLIDLYLFLAVTFGTLIIARGLALVIPSEYYFTFQSLFTDRPAQILAVALLLKMAGPLVCGVVLGWLAAAWALRLAGPAQELSSFKRRLWRQWAPTVFLGGFSAAFLTAWPIIVYWDLLSNPVVAHLKPIFFILYVLYMFGYGYMALLGFLGTIFLREQLARADGEKKLVSLPELSRVGVLWILNSGIASAAMEVITK